MTFVNQFLVKTGLLEMAIDIAGEDEVISGFSPALEYVKSVVGSCITIEIEAMSGQSLH